MSFPHTHFHGSHGPEAWPRLLDASLEIIDVRAALYNKAIIRVARGQPNDRMTGTQKKNLKYQLAAEFAVCMDCRADL